MFPATFLVVLWILLNCKNFFIHIYCSVWISSLFLPQSCWLLVRFPPNFTNFLSGFDLKRFFPGLLISYVRLFPSFLFGCFQRLNNSPNCPNSLVAHQIHFVLPWASKSTNRSAGRHRQPMRGEEAAELTNQSGGCHLPTQTAAISLKLV